MRRSNSWLSESAWDTSIPTYTSQRGEDRILQRLFDVIGITTKWCVEFGATDGRHKSNTWYWINKQQWQSVQIEASRDRNLGLRSRHRWSFEALVARYKNNRRVTCLNEWVDTTGPRRLDALLAKTALPQEFDLLSIDVDSSDYAIWNSLVDYSPRVVVIEHNKTTPIEVHFHSNHSSSLRALVELGKEKGYELAAANDLNAIFVRRELFALLGIADNSLVELWRENEQYRMYLEETEHGLVLIGSNRLRWVRGHDGTITGQLRSGKYRLINAAQRSLVISESTARHEYVSGWLRHLWWTLVP